MIAECKAFLLANSSRWKLPARGEWTFVFHNNYHPHCNSINLLWFRQRDQFPIVVTKIYRDPEILNREFDNLKRVHAAAPDLVPRPLHLGQLAGFWMLWMTGLPGSRFRIEEKYSQDALRSIVEALIALHTALRTATADGATRYRKMVSAPLEAVSSFEHSSAVRTSCKALAARISPDWVSSLPVIPQHGDFFSGNLLLHKEHWHIVDWETFGFVDLPLYDLFTFCLSLLRAGAGNPETWPASLPSLIAPLVSRYCKQFSLLRSDGAVLLPLTLVNWFHIQWADGRREFAERTYEAIESYFRDTDAWETAILGS